MTTFTLPDDVAMGFRSQAPKQSRKERTCEVCGHKLSKYNPSETCLSLLIDNYEEACCYLWQTKKDALLDRSLAIREIKHAKGRCKVAKSLYTRLDNTRERLKSIKEKIKDKRRRTRNERNSF